jgi:hypothetical protein
MDKFDVFKNIIFCIGFFVAVIATLICPFSSAMTAGMVGKLWLAYFAIQFAWAILDGSLAEWVCVMSSLLRRR